jgi:hypothetical protein
VLADDVAWTIPGHHPLSGTKRGIAEVLSFFDQLATVGFMAEPIFLRASDEYVVNIHRGWPTKGTGQVDTTWALVWHFRPDGKVDRVVNLSGDQHQMDAFIWANFDLKPLPDRLARPFSLPPTRTSYAIAARSWSPGRPEGLAVTKRPAHRTGIHVIAMSRARGVDVIAGDGLAAALAGVEAVIDAHHSAGGLATPRGGGASGPPARDTPADGPEGDE